MAGLRLFIALFVAAVAVGGKSVEAEVHHVVGSDSSDIGSWSSGRVFKVGDHIWFNYPAEHESMVELQSMEEYLSCDVSNPIKMYTDKVSLVEEGIRYFASGNLESCKDGHKLHVVVHLELPTLKDPLKEPKQEEKPEQGKPDPPQPKAPPPPSSLPDPPQPKAPPPPSSAPTYLSGIAYMFGGLLLCLMGL